jgi:hypothetical protein
LFVCLFFSDKSSQGVVELHQELDVNGEARAAITRLGIERQPREGVVTFHDVPLVFNRINKSINQSHDLTFFKRKT